MGDLHLLHPQWYLHHLPALRLHQVMWSKSILTHWNHCLLKVLEIQCRIQCESQLESQHETCCQSLIVMSLSCWNSMMHSLTWNQSLRKMSWIWNFVNDDARRWRSGLTMSDGRTKHAWDRRMRCTWAACRDHHWHQLQLPLHQSCRHIGHRHQRMWVELPSPSLLCHVHS